MKALEAFRMLLSKISIISSRRFSNVPGEVIKSLSKEARQALTELKSDEIGPEVRVSEQGWYGGEANLAPEKYYQEQEDRKDRLEFDKKLKK